MTPSVSIFSLIVLRVKSSSLPVTTIVRPTNGLFALSQYAPLRQQVLDIDEKIQEVKEELAELNKYNVKVSPVYTGMPNGNEKRDKIADFIIKLEEDRARLANTLDGDTPRHWQSS